MLVWILLGLGIIAVAVILWLIATYNGFVQLRNAIDNNYKQIQVAMKKRMDMIGQLVDVASSYMKFEKGVMTDVTKLRQMPVTSASDLKKANDLSTSVFGRLMAVMENYPKLEAVGPVKELQGSIKDVEDEIARLRYLYNDVVQKFNTMAETIPSNFVASLMHLVKKEYLEFGKEVEKVPNTKLM